MSETVYDPFAEIVRQKPSDAECREIYGRVIRELSVVGEVAAIEMVVNMLGFLLWSKGTPPSGPLFEIDMAALRHNLRVHLKCLETASQKGGAHVH
jgi:hypothetical protein